jgi:hypothetical protein
MKPLVLISISQLHSSGVIKLYEAIAEIKKSTILTNIIQIDGTFLPINLKGTKPKNMPRISKKRSSSAY